MPAPPKPATTAAASAAATAAAKNLITKGSCYCGAVKFSTKGAPIATVICHCESCRKWGGGMGQLATLFKDEQVEVKGETGKNAKYTVLN
jgi:hypothetical protein